MHQVQSVPPIICFDLLLFETSDFGHVPYSKNQLVPHSYEIHYSNYKHIETSAPEWICAYMYCRGRTVQVDTDIEPVYIDMTVHVHYIVYILQISIV